VTDFPGEKKKQGKIPLKNSPMKASTKIALPSAGSKGGAGTKQPVSAGATVGGTDAMDVSSTSAGATPTPPIQQGAGAPEDVMDATPAPASQAMVLEAASPHSLVTPCGRKIAMWNIANLGGGFGYPVKREPSVIGKIAHILVETHAFLCVILEVLDHSRPFEQRSLLTDFQGQEIKLPRDLRGRASVPQLLDSFIRTIQAKSVGIGTPEIPADEGLMGTLWRLWRHYGKWIMSDKKWPARDKKLWDAMNALAVPMAEDAVMKLGDVEEGESGVNKAIGGFAHNVAFVLTKEFRSKESEKAGPAAVDAKNKDAGVDELRNIHAAMGGAYVLTFPETSDGRPDYRSNESYGFIYSTNIVEAVTEPQFLEGFAGRPPALIWVKIKDQDRRIGVIAWHPPSDSLVNSDMRTADFRAFSSLCNNLRASHQQDILLLAFDANIDTCGVANSDWQIPHCEGWTVHQFFREVSNGEPWPQKYGHCDYLTSLRRYHKQPEVMGEDPMLCRAFDKFIFVNKGNEVRHAHSTVLTYQVENDDALREARDLSDHLPIVIDVEWQPGTAQPKQQ